MDTQDSAIRLAQLFREAGAAHHQAFAGTNGEDAAWPAWYAAFLSPRLSGLLGGSVSADVLAADLVIADRLTAMPDRGVGGPSLRGMVHA
jgi:hypothetical protein